MQFNSQRSMQAVLCRIAFCLLLLPRPNSAFVHQNGFITPAIGVQPRSVSRIRPLLARRQQINPISPNWVRPARRFPRPPQQRVIQVLWVMTAYLFHLVVLTQNAWTFSIQLTPYGPTQIGWDSLAGICVLLLWNKFSPSRSEIDTLEPLPPWTQDETTNTTLSIQNNTNATWILPKARIAKATSFVALIVLLQAYFWTGRLSLFWEDALYDGVGRGWLRGMSQAMHRSWVVLLGHLSWVGLGFGILRFLPRPQPFWNQWIRTPKTAEKRNRDWVYWTIGGYYVSSLFFNMADALNQFLLPTKVFEDNMDTVVSQLINPEHNEWFASLVGFVAPCLTAPWWEEVLYRGFVLPTLQLLFQKWWLAVAMSGILFSAHHLSLVGAIPLCVLGWTWAILYRASGNLWNPIFVHALWNSRVFLGNWLGL